MHFKPISAWTVTDVASGAAVAILVVSVIVAVALIIHRRRDVARYLTAHKTGLRFGKIVASLYSLIIYSALAAMFVMVVVLAVANIPWPAVGSFLVAVPAIIAMPFEAVWNSFKDQSLGEQILIIAIVMTWLIIAAIKKAANRIIAAMAMIEADRRRH
jgi:hypothetical protein